MDTKGSSTDDSINPILSQNNTKPSFEKRLKDLKGLPNNNNKIKNRKKLKFRDEIERNKAIADVVDIESFKLFNNIEMSQELQCESCNCILI